MVKLSGQAAGLWVESPNRDHWAVLFYGPNQGLVSDRSRRTVTLLSGGVADDPFTVSMVDPARLKSDPSVIRDEVMSQSLMGGDKTVWVKEGSDKIVGDLEAIADQTARPNFLVIEAGDLPPRSKLRSFFERSAQTASIGCYDDDERALSALVSVRLSEWDITADRDTIGALVGRLGRDRLDNLAEIEKICLFAGHGGDLKEEDIVALSSSSGGASLDELVYSVFEGSRQPVDRLLADAWSDGVSPVQVIRRLQGHLHRLLLVKAKLDGGEPMEKALKSLRPPVFFKFKERFSHQTRRWPQPEIERSLAALTELEVECKSTGAPDQALCERICLSIAGLAHRL